MTNAQTFGVVWGPNADPRVRIAKEGAFRRLVTAEELNEVNLMVNQKSKELSLLEEKVSLLWKALAGSSPQKEMCLLTAGDEVARRVDDLRKLELTEPENAFGIQRDINAATRSQEAAQQHLEEVTVLCSLQAAPSGEGEVAEEVVKLRTQSAAFEELVQVQADSVRRLREDLLRLDRKGCFFTLYNFTEVPRNANDVLNALDTFVIAFARQVGADPSMLLENLHRACENTRPAGVEELHYVIACLWTSGETLRGSDMKLWALCNMLSKASREEDAGLLMSGGMTLQKALSVALVDRRGNHEDYWPEQGKWHHTTFRGAGIAADALRFWSNLLDQPEDRRGYRTAAPLSTSTKKSVAETFLGQVQAPLEKVLFIFKWEPIDRPCLHARYIEEISSCRREEELLLVTRSVLRVESLVEATAAEPVTITLKVAVDNKLEPEYLPVTKWH